MVLALGPIIVGFMLAVLAVLILGAEVTFRMIAGAGRFGKEVLLHK